MKSIGWTGLRIYSGVLFIITAVLLFGYAAAKEYLLFSSDPDVRILSPKINPPGSQHPCTAVWSGDVLKINDSIRARTNLKAALRFKNKTNRTCKISLEFSPEFTSSAAAGMHVLRPGTARDFPAKILFAGHGRQTLMLSAYVHQKRYPPRLSKTLRYELIVRPTLRQILLRELAPIITFIIGLVLTVLGYIPTSSKSKNKRAADGEEVAESYSVRFAPPAYCIHRENELAKIVEHLKAKDCKPGIVLGPPGVGKSTLIRRAAHESAVRQRFGNRRFLINCETLKSKMDLVSALGRQLGVSIAGSDADFEYNTIRALNIEPSLLIFDNLEVPWGNDRAAVEDFLSLLANQSNVALLVGIRGTERPREIRWCMEIEPRLFEIDAARDLFSLIAKAEYPGEEELLLDLLSRMQGLPLAITLLARQAESMKTIANLNTAWQANRSNLLRENGSGQSRLTSLPISIELSYSSPLVSDDARRLVAIVARLPAGVAHGHIDELLDEKGRALTAASVLRKTGLAYDDVEEQRLRMLPPILEYFKSRYAASREDQSKVARLYLRLAHELGGQVGELRGEEAVSVLRAEAPNIEAMLTEQPPWSDALLRAEAALGFARFGILAGRQISNTLLSVIAQFKSENEIQKAAACTQSLAEFAVGRGWHDAAVQYFNDASKLFELTGSVQGKANCTQGLGQTALSLGDLDAAYRHFEDARNAYAAIGDALGRASALRGQGDVAQIRKHHDTAREFFEQAVELYRQVGSLRGVLHGLFRLGEIAQENSNFDTAFDKFQKARDLFEQTGDVLGEANCLMRLAENSAAQSEPDDARKQYGEALEKYRLIENVRGEANCLIGFAEIERKEGNLVLAEDYFKQALTEYRRVGHMQGEGNCILQIGIIRHLQGDPSRARMHFQEALELFSGIPSPYSIGHACELLATVARSDSERESFHIRAFEAWGSIGRQDLIDSVKSKMNSEN